VHVSATELKGSISRQPAERAACLSHGAECRSCDLPSKSRIRSKHTFAHHRMSVRQTATRNRAGSDNQGKSSENSTRGRYRLRCSLDACFGLLAGLASGPLFLSLGGANIGWYQVATPDRAVSFRNSCAQPVDDLSPWYGKCMTQERGIRVR